MSEPLLFDFVQQYLRDADEGTVQPLSAYLARFPGLESEVAEEFLALERWRREPPEAPEEEDEQRIGPYRLLHLLGSGGQGVVYAAEDTRVDRRVALKVLHPGWARLSATDLMRFRREAEIVARLDHSGICPIYEADTDHDTPFLAMRLIEGETLRERLARPDHRVDREEAVATVEQVARTLAAAHALGIIHRDVKPGNLMLATDGRAVLLDFGLARLEDSADTLRTRTGAVLGTPTYMAPEVVDRGAGVDTPACDVYSLGAVLYEWIAGRPPFTAPTREALFNAITTGPARDLRALAPDCPRDLAVVVATALDPSLERRYRDAAAFAEELGRLRRGEPVLARPLGPIQRAARWCRRHPARAGLVAALLLGLITSLHFWTRARRAVAEYDIVAGAAEMAHLRLAAARLWPAQPQRIEDLRLWIRDARALAKRLPALERTLIEMRVDAVRVPAPDHREDPRVVGDDGGALVFASDARGVTWRVRGPGQQFRHDVLAEYVRELRRFDDPDRGLIADVARRLAHAETVQRRSIDEVREAWNRTCADLRRADHPAGYDSLALPPQVGLVPLGPDPVSGLHEFVDLFSAGSGPGAIPTRDERGALRFGPKSGVVFILLPGGRFLMGAAPPATAGEPGDVEAEGWEAPAHEVRLAPFFISKFEVTQPQWRRITGRSPSFFKGGEEAALPLEFVTWIEVDRWSRRLGWVLPTEAQWEYAARGGTRHPWPHGRDRRSLDGAENLAGLEFRAPAGYARLLHEAWNDGHERPWLVGSGRPNPFGLLDVLGNVAEWCLDDLIPYEDSELRAGDGLRTGSDHRGKVFRGGSWLRDAHRARASARLYNRPDFRRNSIGFRPARAITRD